MVVSKLHSFFYGNSFNSFEHISSSLIHVSIIEKKNEELFLIKCSEISRIEEFKKIDSTAKQSILTLNIDQVLTKKIDTDQTNINKLINEAFPNLSLSEFYYQIISTKSSKLISICRKKIVDTVIESYKSENISVFDIFLGFSSTVSLSEYHNESEILGSNFSVKYNGSKEITSFYKSPYYNPERIYELNTIKIPNTHLLNFSSLLTHLNRNNVIAENVSEITQPILESFNTKRFQKLLLTYGLGFIFLILVVNFLFFMSYFNKVENLRSLSQVNMGSKEKLSLLAKEVKQKEKTITDIYNVEQSRLSLIVNSLIISMPKSILLEELTLNPILKPIKADKTISIDDNKIILSGNTISKNDFDQWILALEKIKQIDNIEIIEFADMNKSSSFRIKIVLL